MDAAGIPALQDAIRYMEECESRHLATVQVHEDHDGETVWKGDVEAFELIDHAKADLAYAWSEVTTGQKRRFFVVLHAPPVDSAAKAVQASILADAQR